MQHSFREFLRHGGNGQFILTAHRGVAYGYRAHISVKSLVPGYSELRADFAAELDRVIADNTRILLNALTPPDSVPWVRETDLRDVSDAKEEALRQWDERLTAIYAQYQTHPQRLRPLRASMEERLLRAFAGLINQLRQQDLGIERYIWRSQNDAKVRASHAEYDDHVFRWNEPPEGGHPGQAHNCRCYAEPVGFEPASDVILVDYVPTDEGYPLQDLLEHEAKGGHTIALHVGKSEAFLRTAVRIDQAPGFFISQFRKRHGSFPSL
jgi:hypothetical protein